MDFLLKPPSNFRAHRHSDFVTPPLDGSLTIPELYDFHYENNPNHPVFIFADDSGVTTDVLFREVVPAAHNAARFVAKATGIDLQSAKYPRFTVAILAATDTITYFTTVLGMLRAEIPVFPISPRNSAAAVAHLLSTTHATHVLVSTDDSIQQLAKAAIGEFDQDAPKACPMPTFEDIYISGSPLVSLPARGKDYSATRVIVHSSGSSSGKFPKSIIWNDRSYLQVAMAPLFGKHDFAGEIFGCHTGAMFHGIGLKFIAWVASTGLMMATFPPVSPAVIRTPENIWKGTLNTSPSYLFAPPSFFEGWSQDPSKLSFFKQLKGIVYGGAPLPKGVGDYFAKEGVAVYTFYGSSEVGPFCEIFPEHPGLDWEYLSLNTHCATEFVALGDGTYELVVLAKPTTELTTVNRTYQGGPAYATNDILVPHPTKAGRWKVLGRMDDRIILTTGDKINPGPLEDILCQHPYINTAVLFGGGKPQNGVLIEVAKENYFDSQDVDKLNVFRDQIWPQVETMNTTAAACARLTKEMIIVANSAKPFTYTPKGAPRRAVILSAYDDEIEEAYINADKGAALIQRRLFERSERRRRLGGSESRYV